MTVLWQFALIVIALSLHCTVCVNFAFEM